MGPLPIPAPKWDVAGHLIRGARSLYQLLGNRRKSARVPVSGTIFMTSGRAIVSTCVCSLVDISPRGIGIDSPESIAPNDVVALHAEEYGPRRLARVRQCEPHGQGYRIGLEFIVGTGE